MKKITTLATAILLVGCTATNTLPERNLEDGRAYLAPIHVMVDNPFRSSELRNGLRTTGVFDKVETGAGAAGDYAVRVKLDSARNSASFPVLLLSAATLFLMPLPREIDTTAEFTLLRDGAVLKQYRYRNLTEKYVWLLDQGGEMPEQNIDRIVRAFAGDVRQDALLPEVEAVQ